MIEQPTARGPGSPSSWEVGPVLTVADLHVRYGGSHVLQGVSFDVPATACADLRRQIGGGTVPLPAPPAHTFPALSATIPSDAFWPVG